MPKRVEFWFDYTCPYAYIASTQVTKLTERMGAELSWQPMLLGGIFKANATPQNLSETLIPAKLAHNEQDFARWASAFGVRLSKPNGHPMRSVEALRVTLASGCDPRVIEGFYRAYWEEGRPVSDEATLRDVVVAAGKNPHEVLAASRDERVKEDLRRRTDRAIALGIFGAPAFVVDGRAPGAGPGDERELYWGQDRMHFVAGVRMEDVLPPIARGPRGLRDEARTLEVYWDFSSPFSYLGVTQAEALAARTGATLVWRPMLLGGLFKAVGQPMVPLMTWSPAKRAYYGKDIQRWAAYWRVPFTWNSRFPINSLKAMRCYMALGEGPARDAFRASAYRAAWAEDKDITDDALLGELLAAAGADPREILGRAQSPEVKKALVDATERAAAAGVFGAPTWVVDGEQLFWGQDRIPLVERALVG